MEEEIRFQCKIAYDYRALLALNRVTGKTTQKWRYRLSRGFELAYGIFLLLLGVSGLWLGMYDKSVVWLCLVLGAIFFALGIFHYPLSARRSAQLAMKQVQTADVHMTFTDSGITVCGEGFTTKYEYSMLMLFSEWEHYLVFMVDKKHGFAIDEDTIVGGTPAELCQFLTEKTGLWGMKLR